MFVSLFVCSHHFCSVWSSCRTARLAVCAHKQSKQMFVSCLLVFEALNALRVCSCFNEWNVWWNHSYNEFMYTESIYRTHEMHVFLFYFKLLILVYFILTLNCLNFVFRSFLRCNSRWAPIVYRLIGAALIGIFFPLSLLDLKFKF